MRRIGVAASTIAKGNIWLYHLAVLVISCLFALFAFFVCGFVVGTTIFILSLLFEHLMPSMNAQVWVGVLRTCLMILGALIGILTLVAIIKNIKLNSKL